MIFIHPFLETSILERPGNENVYVNVVPEDGKNDFENVYVCSAKIGRF